jgi:hypothetical protein
LITPKEVRTKIKDTFVKVRKADLLHAMEVLRGRGITAPTFFTSALDGDK